MKNVNTIYSQLKKSPQAGLKLFLIALMMQLHLTSIAQSDLIHNTGDDNIFVGEDSGTNITTGANNTAIGTRSLQDIISGHYNVATGVASLASNISGNYNVATGLSALNKNNGSYNVAIGALSLFNNLGGNYNVATGYNALFVNSSGKSNTATGTNSLYSNRDGKYNVATGAKSLYTNESGSYNVSNGYQSLHSIKSGNSNTAIGTNSLYSSTGGDFNVATGAKALYYSEMGYKNTAIGYNSGPGPYENNLTNTTAIGNGARVTASGQVRIGNDEVTSIGGLLDWATLSDGRFKEAVKEDVSGLEFVNKLRPVSYTVNKKKLKKFLGIEDSKEDGGVKSTTANNTSAKRHTGFIAQEVEAIIKETGYVFNGIQAPQNENDHYSIQYAEFVMPLVKSVQELSANAEVQSKELEEQNKTIDVLTALAKTQAEAIAKQQEQITALLANNKVGVVTEEVVNSDAGIQLFQNRPNPFTEDTNIEMELSSTTVSAKILIYNLEGREIKSIIVENRGKTRVQLSARELNAGMYIYALIADGKVIDTKRMILTK